MGNWQYIGRKASDGSRVFVEITIGKTNGLYTTTEHKNGAGGKRISIVGAEIEKGRRNASKYGQLDLRKVRIDTSDSDWSQADVESLRSLWAAWHLNDMKAACAHMDADKARAAFDRRETVLCPAGSGYKYGSAWLYQVPSARVLTEVARLAALPAGKIPAGL